MVINYHQREIRGNIRQGVVYSCKCSALDWTESLEVEELGRYGNEFWTRLDTMQLITYL